MNEYKRPPVLAPNYYKFVKKFWVKVYTPNKKEKEILSNAFGHTNPVWEPVKKRLLGSNGLAVFDDFYKVVHG